MSTAQPMVPTALLDPLRFPLRGSRLIEASAGTGKTFTIAALYLRLVLGHGGAAAFSRPLNPPEILVVTFTDAATKELRDRIRARLAEAADAFLVDPGTVMPRPAGEDLLHDLRADYPPADWAACARRLRLAAEWMDEAAVSTIHGWCNRMLTEHAFDSGSLFTQTLETDLRPLQMEALRDYWRSHIAPLDVAHARQAHDWWATPDALWAEVRPLLGVLGALPRGLPFADAVAQAQESSGGTLAGLKAPWRGADGWAAHLRAGLDAAVEAKRCKMPKRKDWMQMLADWAEGDAVSPGFTDTAKKRLTRAGMRAEWSGDDSLLTHDAWVALEQLDAAIAQLPEGRQAVLCHAAHWIAERLLTEQSRRALMGFDDLLTRLDKGLHGPNGARLAALIRQQFPVALIDEFQDTDTVQYRIFDAIYGVDRDDQQTALVLIGDPKQAIYAFRGADIHTYLRARQDTAGRHATLGTNYRSTKPMVDAVNRVFLRAEERPEGTGAFLFREAEGNRLPFQAMGARGRKEQWRREGPAPAALTVWHWDEAQAEANAGKSGSPSKERVRMLGAEACATQIVALLAEGRQGLAGFADDKGVLTGVQASDIAVLVNNGEEANAVRHALSRRGVRSVYLSDKSSVFDSPMAGDLQRLLAACADPDDNRALHAALGSGLLGQSWAELDRLGQDELRWEALLLQFRGYQQLWARQGVLPMLRRLLNDFGVPRRLRAAQDERGLTDLLHLAELLQSASTQLDGQHALIRWLAEEQHDHGEDQDERKLRLESDAELVKVVTIHKSKGLEYPLVFLPFATSFRAAKADDMPLKWSDGDGRQQVALQSSAEIVQQVDQERLGEDLRKLYVALTRARHATWIVAAPVGQVERSALGYLLGGGASLAGDALPRALDELAQGCASIAVEALPEPTDALFVAALAEREPAPRPPLARGLRDTWWVTSYSGLSRTGAMETDTIEAPVNAPDTAAQDIYTESLRDAEGEEPATAATAAMAGIDLHGFPRGAAPGHFLHGLLEWAARQGFARVRSDAAVQAELADLIARRCNLRGWQAWIETLRSWLLRWIATPWKLEALAPAGAAEPLQVAPADLTGYQVEMEFWLAVSDTNTVALDALVRQHTLGGAARAPLLPRQVNGMLKGFIDLTFEHAGRYYVADYKSNHLGATDAHYTPAAMRDAILAHRYDLQYVLYLYALHRLLRTRLPDYDYERHVGGAVYIFLRGAEAPSQGLHCERPPLALIEAMDRLFDGAASNAAPSPGVRA